MYIVKRFTCGYVYSGHRFMMIIYVRVNIYICVDIHLYSRKFYVIMLDFNHQAEGAPAVVAPASKTIKRGIYLYMCVVELNFVILKV